MECSSVVTYRGARDEATSKREAMVNCILLVMICLFDEVMIECKGDEMIDADKTEVRESLRSNILLLLLQRLCHKIIQDRCVVGISSDISQIIRARP